MRNSKWNIFWALNEKEQIGIYDLAEMNIEPGKQQRMSMNSVSVSQEPGARREKRITDDDDGDWNYSRAPG